MRHRRHAQIERGTLVLFIRKRNMGLPPPVVSMQQRRLSVSPGFKQVNQSLKVVGTKPIVGPVSENVFHIVRLRLARWAKVVQS